MGFTILSRVFATICLAIPLLIVPVWSYKADNWWLLFGSLISVIGSFIGMSKKGYSIVSLTTIICIGFWIKGGFSIHQYITFYYFCFLFGSWTYTTMTEYNKKRTEIHDSFNKFMQEDDFNRFLESEGGKELTRKLHDLKKDKSNPL